jgi:energy-coupling factor transport system permease protein
MLEFEARGSFIEKLDPRAKMLMACLFSAGAIMAHSLLQLSLLLLCLFVIWQLARLSLIRHRFILGVLLICALVSILTQSVFYGTFWGMEPSTILFEFTSKDTPVVGRLAVTLDGIKYGCVITLRFWGLLLAATLLPLTTHPSDLMLSLVKIRVPFFVVVIFTLGFRFIPLIQRNLFQLMDAQKLRGIEPFSPKGVAASLNALLGTTLRTADELALSLETRAFCAAGKRTFYRQLSFSIGDMITLISGVLIVISILLV